MKKQLSLVLAVVLLCTVLINPLMDAATFRAYAAEQLEEVQISGFETEEEVWQFGLGDGTGAQGSFVRDEIESYEGAFSGKLSGSFGAGGSFVVLSRGFLPIDMKSLSFQIKTSDINKITIRLKDAKGQVHQQTIVLQASEDWQKVEVTAFDRGLGYLSFGSGTPGVWNGPADRIEFLLEKSRLTGGKTSGTVWIDDIKAMAEPQQELWKTEVGSFENTFDLWELAFGMEFPGANGDFIRDSAEVISGVYSGKLSGDFSNGGKYLSLGSNLPPVSMKKLEFWTKTSDAQWVTLRIKDGSGQVHQQKVPLTPNGQWSKVEILKFNGGKGYFSFGGANDQKWHDPVQRVEVLMDQSSFVSGKLSGDIWIDQVEMTSEFPNLTVQQTQLGNIFLENEPVALQIATQGSTVNWSVYDHLEQKVLEGSEPVQEHLLNLTIPLQSYGYYTVTIDAEKDGQMIAEAEVSLARLSAEDPTLVDDSPFGISTHLAWVKEGWSTELSKLIRRAGAKSFRDEITWESLEYEKGKYRKPANRDAFMKRTLEDDLNPFIILNYTNPFYDQNSTPYTNEGRAGFANYGVALLDLYGNQIEAIEVYNEFNGSFGSRGNGLAGSRPDSYYEMLKTTYEKIKAARPDVTVVGMATAGTPLDWIEEVFKLGGLDYMDAVSIHPYQSQRPPDGMVQAVRSVQELMRKYNNGQEKPIWYTEIGWPTKASIGIPENTQANYVVRTYVQALGEGVEKVFWYDLMNDGMQEDYYEHHLGLLRNREDEKGAFTPKPSYASYATMTRELIGADFVEQEYAGSDIFSYKFEKSGEQLRVVWSNEPLQTAIETDTPIQITDMMGNSKTYSPYQGKVFLTLSGEPHYIKGEVKSMVKSSMFSIYGEPVVAGEAVHLTLQMNNNGAVPAKVSFEFEGKKYELEAEEGQQTEQPLQQAAISKTGSRVLTGYLQDEGRRIGKLQYVVQSLHPYEVKVYPALESKDLEQKAIALHIKNFSKQNELVINGIEWQLGNQQGMQTDHVLVQSDGTAIIKIGVAALNREESYPVQIKVNFEQAEPFEYEGKFDFNPIHIETVAVDGKLDEGIEESVPTIHLSQGTVQMTDYKGKVDLDGQFWLHFDRDHFYLSAKVVDDVHAYQAEGADIWKNDSIQFAIAQGVPGSASEWYEYGISDTAKGPQIYRWNAPTGAARGPVSNGQLQITRDEEQKLTIYELALPWSELAPMKYNQPDGIHFSLLVNDNDGSGRKGWIEWASGIGLEKKPSLFRSMQWILQAYEPVIQISGIAEGESYRDGVTPEVNLVDESGNWQIARMELDSEPWMAGTEVIQRGSHTFEVWTESVYEQQISKSVSFELYSSTVLELGDASGASGEAIELEAAVKDAGGQPVSGGEVALELYAIQPDGTAIPVEAEATSGIYLTNEKGVAAIELSLAAGLYEARMKLHPGDYYFASEAKSYIAVNDSQAGSIRLNGHFDLDGDASLFGNKAKKVHMNIGPDRFRIHATPQGIDWTFNADWMVAVEGRTFLQGTAISGGESYTVRIMGESSPNAISMLIWNGTDTSGEPVFEMLGADWKGSIQIR
ncbi:glycosyl hydrolase [Paenibacillus sp. J5C_2022]|uniref:sugar-binding protein n=1 Tax=Paenibacillus sp. J5C2022 TaxID=2977129 RepID=UPI0021D3A134|nr:sugar-binding protein [Paenibacillus sp. J5C2022]MCU6707815.1 glycosyl hydrolase [Paenibacillus sp. J5C2022]